MEAASRTLGIDLASQPRRTAACLIEWAGGRGAVIEHEEGDFGRAHLVSLMAEASIAKCGIDAPFGWPRSFVENVESFSRAGSWRAPEEGQESLTLRATDRWVWKAIHVRPLSVSADRLAYPAMRCAGLLSAWATTSGRPLDRTGADVPVEVYPAASLHRWGLPSRRYKGPENEDARLGLVDALLNEVSGFLETSPAFVQRCRESDDQLDALVAALTARAAQLGRVDPIPAELAADAEVEGWIRLPRPESLGGLGGG